MEEAGRSLNAIWVIAKQEFILFFGSPVIYFIGAVWLFISGLFFAFSLNFFNQGFGGEPTLSDTLGVMAFLLLFIAPALTMRLISDEIRAGTHELLFTAPVRDWEIVVGKWLAIWGVLTVFVLIMGIYAGILIWRSTIDPGELAVGYLGLWLTGGASLALGVLASSLTQHQPIAFMLGMGGMLGLYLTNAISQLFTNITIRETLADLSLLSHYQNMINRALIDPVDIAYFIGLSAISLFLAAQVLGTRRWRA